MKRQTLKTFLFAIFAAFASPSSAYVYDACEAAIAKGDTAKIQEFANIIQETKFMSPRVRESAEACVSAAFNTLMVYRQSRWLNVSKLPEKEALELRQKAKDRERKAERAVAERERQKIAAEARLQVGKQLTFLNADLKKLEKQKSCVSAKHANTKIALDAITKLFEQNNQSLILNDTHEACTKLYASEKSEAMLNQTCVDAFNRMGHPNLVFSESEQKNALSAEIVGLLDLALNLSNDMQNTQLEIIKVGDDANEQAFEEFVQEVIDSREAKSCAEFGYEGIYLD
jgi:hypothetical protein